MLTFTTGAAIGGGGDVFFTSFVTTTSNSTLNTSITINFCLYLKVISMFNTVKNLLLRTDYCYICKVELI